MSHNTVVFSTINFEELPLHIEHHSIQTLRPSSIEEDDHDPRSLLYLFEDNDFERAATFLAMEEARQRAQAAAEARAEAEAREQRKRALAARLEQLLEEDDELVDMLGRRILAMNGYQLPDLWQPDHYHHHHHGPQYYQYDPYYALGYQHASTSRNPQLWHLRGRTYHNRNADIHAAWDGIVDQASSSDYARASPFVHAAPLILHGHAPYQSRTTQRAGASSRPTETSAKKVQNPTRTRIAIHPITGVPMLLVGEDSETDQLQTASDHRGEESKQGDTSDDGSDEWAVNDESDLDWLGRELLRRQLGANVWVLGTDDNPSSKPISHANTQSHQSSSSSALPTKSASTLTSQAAKEHRSATPTFATEVEEVDSDNEQPPLTSASQGASAMSSPSQRVAAALSKAALSSVGGSGQTRRQRAATVMSESEEEELETVGRPVVESDSDERGGDRPRKSVKVQDLR